MEAKTLFEKAKEGQKPTLDNYILKEAKGEGSMFYVCVGYNDDLADIPKNWRAIKFPKEGFEGELRKYKNLLDMLDHPNIPNLIESNTKNSIPYVAEELADTTLAEELELHDGYLAEEDVRDVGSQVLDALTYLHSKGIGHTDINPVNILLTKEGAGKIKAYLSDFNLTETEKDKKDESEKQEGKKSLMHSLVSVKSASGEMQRAFNPYQSTEFAFTKEFDMRDDLFSIAKVLYESLTGEVMHIVNPDPREVIPDLENDYSEFFNKAFMPRGRRFQTAEEMKIAWETLIAVSSEESDMLGRGYVVYKTEGGKLKVAEISKKGKVKVIAESSSLYLDDLVDICGLPGTDKIALLFKTVEYDTNWKICKIKICDLDDIDEEPENFFKYKGSDYYTRISWTEGGVLLAGRISVGRGGSTDVTKKVNPQENRLDNYVRERNVLDEKGLSPDGKYLAVASEGHVKVINKPGHDVCHIHIGEGSIVGWLDTMKPKSKKSSSLPESGYSKMKKEREKHKKKKRFFGIFG